MSRRRTAALVLVGTVIGSSITASVFFFLGTKPEQSGKAETVKAVDAGHASAGGEALEIPSATDISGNCVLVGTVSNAQGSAIKGASVHIRVQDDPWSSPDPDVQATTDEKGRFEIRNVSGSLTYQLWAFASGRAVASQEDVHCGTQVDFALDEGAILDLSFFKPNGDPVGPVSVMVAGDSLWPPREAKTDDDGKLTIEGLEAGVYVLWADAAGLAYVSDQPIALQSGRETASEIELSLSGAALATVLDSHGKPIKTGATVVVTPSSTSLLYRAGAVDEKGSAIIPALPAGDYSAQALADGYVETEPIPIKPDDAIAFKMEIGATVAGVVRTRDGIPISGASISVDQEMGASPVTLPAGAGRRFRQRILDAARSGWPRLYLLDKSRVVSGPHTLPLPNEKAQANNDSVGAWRPTDDSGRFFLTGLPSGGVAISASHPEFVMQKAAFLTIEGTSATSDAEVLMSPGSTVTVHTSSEQGYPVPEAEIVAYDLNQEAIREGLSDSDGIATLKGLPGSLRIVAAAEGRVPAATRVDARIGSAIDVEIILPPADRTLRGRVTNANGYGVPGTVVIARSITKGLVHVLTATTEDDGTFYMEGAGSGSYHVTADGAEQGRAQVTDAGYQTDIKLVLDTQAPAAAGISPPEDFAALPGIDKTFDTGYPQDNLGTTAPSSETGGQESFNTQFGEAGQLAVTGPPPGKGGLPITIGGGPGRVTVTAVAPGSSVAVAGLAKGDRIIEIDGNKVKGPDDARRAICGPIGTAVLLKVESRGETFTVVVKRERVRSD